MKRAFALLLAVCSLLNSSAQDPTNQLPEAEIEGRRLALDMLDQRPAENLSFSGVLRIRNARRNTSTLPVHFEVLLLDKGWRTTYAATVGTNTLLGDKLVVWHDGTSSNRYELDGVEIPARETYTSFAGSDFWLADLGLEFLHWPEQRMLKRELRRSRSCTVLESVNPSPTKGAYDKIVSWVDRESGGIVHADAYEGGTKLKEFEPKEFKKVNGQWQLQEMEIRNLRTGSRTQIEFDFKK